MVRLNVTSPSSWESTAAFFTTLQECHLLNFYIRGERIDDNTVVGLLRLRKRVMEYQEKANVHTDASRRAPTRFFIGDSVLVQLPTKLTKGHPRFEPTVQIERQVGQPTFY